MNINSLIEGVANCLWEVCGNFMYKLLTWGRQTLKLDFRIQRVSSLKSCDLSFLMNGIENASKVVLVSLFPHSLLQLKNK